MATENENWSSSFEGNENSGRDGNRFYKDNNEFRPRTRTPRPRFNDNGERPQRSYNREGGNDRGGYRPRYNREGGDRPYNREGGERNFGERRSYGDRPQRSFNREGGDRPYNREGGERNFGERRSWGERPQRSYNREGGERNFGERRSYGDRPQRSFNREGGEQGGYRPYNREGGNDRGGFRPRYNSNNNGGGYNRGGYGRPQRRTGDYDPNAKYSKKKQIEYKEAFVDPNEPIRLNKYLANAGICSRREADEFITAGVVSVNGEVVTELGTKIKRSDLVKFHDEPISIERKVYVLLNKPKDCVTTSDDPQARQTVMDFVKDACDERIYPVGRLDRNTTGVLLLTNDGDLASKLTHPKYLKKKIYHAVLDKNLTRADMDQIAAGIQLEDGEIHADAISYVGEEKKNEVGIEIHSGKNRIVRRIFESLGYKVVRLDRVFFAGLTKKGLRRGEWRYLTENEVSFLRMGSFE